MHYFKWQLSFAVRKTVSTIETIVTKKILVSLFNLIGAYFVLCQRKIRANFHVVLHRVNNGALSSCHFFRLRSLSLWPCSRATLYFLFLLNKFSRYERERGYKFTFASISVHRNGLKNGLKNVESVESRWRYIEYSANIYESSREPVYQSSRAIILHLLLLCIPPRGAILFIFH